MRLSRPIGLFAALLVGIVVIGSVSQLGISAFDHAGVIPALVLLAAVLVIAARLGAKDAHWVHNPYW